MIFNDCFWGRGTLAKAKGGAKRRVLRKKRVPTDKYVWGCNPQSALAVHVRTCTDYDKVALIPNGHLCRI